MPVPNFQLFMLPVLKHAQRGNVRISEISDAVALELGLSDSDLEELVPSGTKTTFYDRINWAKTYLKQAGLVKAESRGVFSVTNIGEEVLQKGVKKIDINYLKQFPEFMRSREKVNAGTADNKLPILQTVDLDTETPDDRMRAASQSLNETLGSDILERLRVSKPAFFERVVVQLLLSMGYGGTFAQAGKAIGRSGDNGIDGVIDQDTLGLDRVYVQAKRYAEDVTVGAGDIRDFFGSLDMHKASKGLFVTTSTFTKAAIETVEKLGKRIVLIDGKSLSQLMIRFNVGCRVEEIFEMKKIDEEFFE
jgi:restriction system protein